MFMELVKELFPFVESASVNDGDAGGVVSTTIVDVFATSET